MTSCVAAKYLLHCVPAKYPGQVIRRYFEIHRGKLYPEICEPSSASFDGRLRPRHICRKIRFGVEVVGNNFKSLLEFSLL